MDLNVLYFAHVKERVGLAAETVSVPDGSTVREVASLLARRHPSIAPLLASVRFAVDGEFARPDDPVPAGSEFVLVPPVAGGSGAPEQDPRAGLTGAPLDASTLEALSALVSDPAFGAVATFTGTVRDHARGRAVTRLHYEAYESMALRKLAELVGEVEAAFPGTRLAVRHRVGTLEVGDVAVQIACGAAHRGEAFDACRRLLDRLKQDVPIWKREIGPAGEEWVSDRP